MPSGKFPMNASGNPTGITRVMFEDCCCVKVVYATNCIHFRWADLSVNPGPEGENNNNVYGPLIISAPGDATQISISAWGQWKPYDDYPWVDPNGDGGWPDWEVETDPAYVDSSYNSLNIPVAGSFIHGWLIGFWSDGSSSTGAIGNTIYQIGSAWNNQVPANATELVLGFHDAYNWTDCEGSVEVSISWDIP